MLGGNNGDWIMNEVGIDIEEQSPKPFTSQPLRAKFVRN
jgi:hypothetical protein